jgi:hypothetical protein
MKKKEIAEARGLYHEVMFGNKDMIVGEKEDGILSLNFGDGDIVDVSKAQYVEGFNVAFFKYAMAVAPKKECGLYRVIACGKYFEGEDFADVFGRAAKRLYKKGCLEEAAEKQALIDNIMGQISDMDIMS